jgi:succinate-semialdehyde dehydrogenase / glutarate-semialdehyde dehydrogenase
VQEQVYDAFVDKFTEALHATQVANGLESSTQMGPLANRCRIAAMEALIGDAVERGAGVRTGGHRIGNKGNFFEPTVPTNVPKDARVMNEEPFGPVALVAPFSSFEDAVTEANRLPYGLAAYAFTHLTRTANAIAASVETGMMLINHYGLALPETPFGGVKDSGYGSEGIPAHDQHPPRGRWARRWSGVSVLEEAITMPNGTPHP